MSRTIDDPARKTPKTPPEGAAPRGAADDAPGASPLPGTGAPPRARYRHLVRPLAWWALGALVLGTVLAPRDDAPGAFGTPAPAPLAALPADLHGALREPVAADVAPPPAAGADGFRTLAGHRFPDLAAQGLRPARSLTRLTLAGDTAATLYRSADGCDFTLGVAPGSLAAMLMFTGEPPAHARATGGARRLVALVAGFEPSVRLRAWSAHDAVWVASSDAIDPVRFAALADLAARRTNATSAPADLVHVARADAPAGGAYCGAG